MRGYRIELKPNVAQRSLLAKSSGVARYAYNWKLGQINNTVSSTGIYGDRRLQFLQEQCRSLKQEPHLTKVA